jgi:hypothetical protein
MKMEHRGIEYTVLRAISPNGWRWSVEDKRSAKSGTAQSHEIAVMKAQRYIDGLVKRRIKP